MKLADEIDEMNIEEIRADFYALMNEIVIEHGDKQEAPAGQQETEEEEPEVVNA